MVNMHTPSNRLQQMKDEIVLLKEELVTARLESRSVSSVITTSSVGGANTGSEEVEGRSLEGEGEGEGRQHLEELEDQLNQSQALLQSYLLCVRSVRGKLALALGGGGGGGGDVGEEGGGRRVLEECVSLLALCDGQGVLHLDLPSTTASSADETIAHLRSELEQCRADLRTDESAFAEKAEEMVDLQDACEVLAREKARLEGMWVAAQESEAELQTRVDLLSERLAAALEPAVGGGAVGEASDEMAATGMGVEEVGMATSSEEGVAEVGGDSPSEGVTSISAERQRFEATRSLITGKVKTDCVEVRTLIGTELLMCECVCIIMYVHMCKV